MKYTNFDRRGENESSAKVGVEKRGVQLEWVIDEREETSIQDVNESATWTAQSKKDDRIRISAFKWRKKWFGVL